MEEIGVKAVVIGVSIFVTLVVFTIIIIEFTEINAIYKNVGETDISFEAKFDELDKFRDYNNIFTTLDVINYIKKYADNDEIEVCLNGSCDDNNNIALLNNSANNYETVYKEYTADLQITNMGYRIIFNQK